MASEPKILLTTKRNGYTDSTYYGSIYLADSNKLYYNVGYDENEIFFMRSLAKPIQSSILCDYNIIKDFDIKNKEIAIFCASHSGSEKHIKLLKSIIKKHNIKLKDFLLQPQKPLDLRSFKGKQSKLHNNCSGKHLMMLLMCKYLNLDNSEYTNANHPIQKIILKKQNELSEFNSNILSYDGCGTPLWGLSAKNIIKTYFNLFHDEKYKIIYNSILNNPYIFGGYDRLDSEIITLSNKKLFAKVGAGGFILIYNFKEDKILLIKLTQNNNPIRKLITLDILSKLKWLDVAVQQNEYNQNKLPVAKYCYEFSI